MTINELKLKLFAWLEVIEELEQVVALTSGSAELGDLTIVLPHEDSPEEVREKLRPPHARRGPKPGTAHTEKPVPALLTNAPPVRQRVLALLAKRPYAPLELGEALGCHLTGMSNIYNATNVLKGLGHIERQTPGTTTAADGVVRWCITEEGRKALAAE